MPPCAVKTCAVRPVFARVVGELRAAGPSNIQGPVKQNASPGEQSEAPTPRWKPGQQQNPGPENQDSQHMLEQPRGYFPETRGQIQSALGCARVARLWGPAKLKPYMQAKFPLTSENECNWNRFGTPTPTYKAKT